MRFRSILVGAALAVAVLAGESKAVTYTIADLGTLGGNASYAQGINNSGQITGIADNASGYANAFISNGIDTTGLGTLGGRYSYAMAINDSGQVAGYSTSTGIGDQAYQFYATLYSNGSVTNLGTNGVSSSALDINNVGQVVGEQNDRAAIFYGGNVVSLGTLGGNRSSALSINDFGMIVGWSMNALNVSQAFLYNNGIMANLGVNGGSVASGINNSGQIIGYSHSLYGPTETSFLYSGGVMKDIGSWGGSQTRANGINDKGQIVGYSSTPDEVISAFLYDNQVMTNLNDLIDSTLGWNLITANSINEFGDIVGTGTLNGQYRAFLLNSITEPAPVPEPSTMLLLGGGIAGLVFWRRKKTV